MLLALLQGAYIPSSKLNNRLLQEFLPRSSLSKKKNMKTNTQFTKSYKLILVSVTVIFLLFVAFRSSSTSKATTLSENNKSTAELEKLIPTQACHCNDQKIPDSLAETLVHYATSKTTPQQTKKEVSVSLRVLEKRSPCNFLVFGLGHDSLMWAGLNHGGRTVFLEEDKVWMKQIAARNPSLEAYHVKYDTKVADAQQLMEIGMKEDCKEVGDPRHSKCQLSLKDFPNELYDIEWDLIMVDAPTGFHDNAPGRMGAIYTAGLMARNREEGNTDIFVHDVDRIVEDKFSKAFLCERYFIEQEWRLRHFTIPSHRALSGRPFCPA